ncbi:MAG: hypothetical protein O8C61_09055 [Candidatus Methanoperedens sp.]|nr:hypothetical protein [Candidatus Methanoperedens sp.]
MKIQYRTILAFWVTTVFVVGLAFGAMNLTNITDVNETNESENVTEIAIEAGNASVIPVVTTVEPATPVETTIEPTTPVSTAKPSPGFGILVAIAAIFICRYRR